MSAVKHSSRRVTIELDELDCELLCSALRLARTTRTLGRKLVKIGLPLGGTIDVDTPGCDEREAKLLELLTIRTN